MRFMRKLAIGLSLVVLGGHVLGQQMYDAFWLNIENLALLKPGPASPVQTALWTWPVSDWVQRRISENALVASIMTEGPKQRVLADEFYAALVSLRPQMLSFSELCAVARQDTSDLETYLLPTSAELAQHPRASDWNLLGISVDDDLRPSSGNAVLIMWWQKRNQSSEANAPMVQEAVSAPCYVKDIVGVPVEATFLNSDPRFMRSRQLEGSHFTKGYPSPFLVDFRPLDAFRPQKRRICVPHDTLHADSPDSVILELSPGCILASSIYKVYPDDTLMLVTRFKTTGEAKGAVPFWWGDINVGSYTAGYSRDIWGTHALLFDMPRCCTTSGRILIGVEGAGTLLLDFVFLLRVGNR